MNIHIDKSKKIPLYRQIAEQIQAQIVSGEIPEGFRFPSERQLADALGVNRTTILNAYKELKADGLMDSHVGRGTTAVRPGSSRPDSGRPDSGRPDRRPYPREPMWEYLFSDYLKHHDNFDVNKYLEIANQKDVISFAAGIASVDTIPAQAFEGIEDQLITGRERLLVSPVTGFYSLRKVICSYMQKRSCFCQPSEIMVLSGSQQGIDLITRAFINPGDVVIIEEPSFFPAIQAFRLAGAKIMAVPMDGDGMNVEILEQLLARYQPKLIYTMPVFHNPCGVSMSMDRRIRLLELAGRYGIPILEDDPYSELYYEAQPMSPLKSMDQDGHVIYLSTWPEAGMDVRQQETDIPAVRHTPADRPAFQLHFPADCGTFHGQPGHGASSRLYPQGIPGAARYYDRSPEPIRASRIILEPARRRLLSVVQAS